MKFAAKNQDLICELGAPQVLMKLIDSSAPNILIEATSKIFLCYYMRIRV